MTHIHADYGSEEQIKDIYKKMIEANAEERLLEYIFL